MELLLWNLSVAILAQVVGGGIFQTLFGPRELVHYILVLSQYLARKFHLRAPHLAWVSPDPPRFSTLTIFAFGFVCGSATIFCAIVYILFG